MLGSLGLGGEAAVKTRAAQELDRLGIVYEVKAYEEVERTALEVAEKLGIPLARSFKTLVVRGDKTGVMLACLPGTKELSFKALAKISGNKRVEMVGVEEINRLTGYIKGAVSPLGSKRNYPVYMDRDVLGHPFISVSAGVSGRQIFIQPQDLVRATGAKVADLGEPL